MFNLSLKTGLLMAYSALSNCANAHELPDYGCTVMMCLANPNGPRDASYCNPYIDGMYEDLAHGNGLPLCAPAGEYAKQVVDFYDPCPSPLIPATRQTHIVEGSRRPGANIGLADITGKPQVSERLLNGGVPDERACIGNIIGNYRVGNVSTGYNILVVDQLLWQKPQSPQAIDVYINGQFSHRVHYGK